MVIKVSSRCLDLGRVMILPQRKIQGLSFKLSRKDSSTMERLGKFLSRAGAQCILLFFETIKEPRGIIYIDYTESKLKPLEILELALKEFPEIEDYQCIEPQHQGLLIDTASFPITVAGERVILVRQTGIQGLIRKLKQELGASAAEALLYNLGVEMGQGLAETHLKLANKLSITDPKEILEKISVPLFTTLGYGELHIKEFKINPQPDILLHIHECIEATAQESTSKPACHLVRGIIERGTSTIFKMPLQAIETKCKAQGYPYCELKLIPQQ